MIYRFIVFLVVFACVATYPINSVKENQDAKKEGDVPATNTTSTELQDHRPGEGVQDPGRCRDKERCPYPNSAMGLRDQARRTEYLKGLLDKTEEER